MRLAVATHSCLLLVDVNSFYGVESIWPLARGYYYGVAVFDDFLVAARRIDPRTKDSPTAFECYGFDGLRLAEPNFNGCGVRDVHQISRDDDTFLACAAHNGVIFRYTLDKVMPIDALVVGDESSLVNSVFVRRDELYYTFHQRGARPSEIRYTSDETVSHSVVLPHTAIHNVYADDDWLYYNASDDGAIASVDHDGDNLRTVELGAEWHPKGMAAAGGTLIVGSSEHAVDTPRRFVSQSRLHFVNLDRWQLEATTTLSLGDSYVGNINEVRVLDR